MPFSIDAKPIVGSRKVIGNARRSWEQTGCRRSTEERSEERALESDRA